MEVSESPLFWLFIHFVSPREKKGRKKKKHTPNMAPWHMGAWARTFQWSWSVRRGLHRLVHIEGHSYCSIKDHVLTIGILMRKVVKKKRTCINIQRINMHDCWILLYNTLFFHMCSIYLIGYHDSKTIWKTMGQFVQAAHFSLMMLTVSPFGQVQMVPLLAKLVTASANCGPSMTKRQMYLQHWWGNCFLLWA